MPHTGDRSPFLSTVQEQSCGIQTTQLTPHNPRFEALTDKTHDLERMGWRSVGLKAFD
jgi:hypothetical protein